MIKKIIVGRETLGKLSGKALNIVEKSLSRGLVHK